MIHKVTLAFLNFARWFVLSMLTALVQALTILVTAIVHTVQLHSSHLSQNMGNPLAVAVNKEEVNNSSISSINSTSNQSAIAVEVPELPRLHFLCYETDNEGYVRIMWQLLLYTTLAFSSIAFLLLTHLCGFHIFLSKSNAINVREYI